MFSEGSDDDAFLGFLINIADNLLILVHLIWRFDSRGLIVPKTGASYTRVYMVPIVTC